MLITPSQLPALFMLRDDPDAESHGQESRIGRRIRLQGAKAPHWRAEAQRQTDTQTTVLLC